MTTPFLFVPTFSWPAAPGGLLYTYAAGGTSNKTTYSDAAGSVPNANPVVLDSNGSATVRLGAGSYHFVLKDSTGTTTLWDQDNYSPIDTTSVGLAIWGQTPAEIAASVTPATYAYAPGTFERYGSPVTAAAINNALLQSAQAGGSPAKAGGRTTYNIGANTLAIPDSGVLDISSASIVSANSTAITFGSNSTLLGYDGASIVSSGAASGTALKKANTAVPAAFYIFGWPSISPTLAGQSGSVGLDFTAAYKGIFEVAVSGYETNVLGGANSDTPQTYYNELRSPRIVCTSGLTGIKLQRGCNSTVILNPQINGALTATKGLWLNSTGGVGPGSCTVLGGYIEGFLDNAATRGLLIADAINFTINGTTFDSVSTTANFAIGVTGVATQCGFYNLGFASGWGSSTKIMSWASSGVYNFVGGAPTNQLCLLGQTTFNTGEANGTTRIGKLFGADMNMTTAAAANYAYQLANTADGQGLLLSNNSSNISSGRSLLSLNRVGGAGYVIDFQNNGAAAGGIIFGVGNPNGVVTGVKGTLYINTSGGAGTTLYVSEAGGTVWVGK